MRLLALLLSLLHSVLLVSAAANPGPCSGACTSLVHDPALIQRTSDGTYFRFASHDGISIHTAPSISGPWKRAGSVLKGRANVSHKNAGDPWAPDVQKVGDTYYCYYSVSTFGAKDSVIGVASSKSMNAGDWTDHGSTGVSTGANKGGNYNAIDGNLVAAGSKLFLTFGSFWDGLQVVDMSSPTKRGGGDVRNIVRDTVVKGNPVEGGYIFPHAGKYYVFFSHGSCCNLKNVKPGDEYKIKVCRADSATGTYVDKSGKSCTKGGGTVVLQSHGNVYAAGGQGVFNDPKHGPVLYYHYVDRKINPNAEDGRKSFGWNKLSFEGGWPSIE
ncbi:arabinan endo-1,5-alpha-L-arabinosidase A [Trichodelitschia bisporula]|uniref:Arabinan endo-1,5-alpha-L-arabinosidase n=1 Tax=Trichodelitschia bisporula TaxID=703511 RepID=A0A6G1I8X8_9PEZI|nr:arabinan endo-1,5-alpha-L-arabinosidase A [Trichodelitschia bisporula]